MDTGAVGKFIAKQRRIQGLTQAELGACLGVSNKTVSRWENGNYLPDLSLLRLLAQTLHVSVDEILAAESGESAAWKQSAARSPFSFAERKAYFKRKWRGEHAALLALLGGIALACAILPLVLKMPWLYGLAPLAALMAYAYQHNRMMRYVEDRLYGTK